MRGPGGSRATGHSDGEAVRWLTAMETQGLLQQGEVRQPEQQQWKKGGAGPGWLEDQRRWRFEVMMATATARSRPSGPTTADGGSKRSKVRVAQKWP